MDAMPTGRTGAATRAGALLLSLLLHVGIGASATRFAPSFEASASPMRESLEVDFMAIDEAVAEVAPSEPQEAELAPPQLRAPTPSRQSPPTRPGSPEPPADSSATAALSPPSPSLDLEASARPMPFASIDPRRVALSLVGLPDLAPATEAPSPPADEHDAEAALDEHLRGVASARHYLSERPPPELRRLRGGSYRLVGSSLSARIQPDGSVSFGDRPAIGYDGDRNQAMRFGFDIGARAEARHGNDVEAAEREWFMRGTEELRHRLEAEARRELEAAASLRLRGRLEALWNAGELSGAEMRMRVFRIWDACSEGGAGARARLRVEAFVRERFPRCSAMEFSADELRSMNATRQGSAAFSPYDD